MKKSTKGVFSAGGPCLEFLFFVYNENYVGLQVLEHKKNPCWTDHALKGGKFIITLSSYFWNILVIDIDKLYAFVCLVYLFYSVYVICTHDLAWYDQTAIVCSVIQTYVLYYHNGMDILYIPYAPV